MGPEADGKLGPSRVRSPLRPPRATSSSAHRPSIQLLRWEACELSVNFPAALKPACQSFPHLPVLAPSAFPALVPAPTLSPPDRDRDNGNHILHGLLEPQSLEEPLQNVR